MCLRAGIIGLVIAGGQASRLGGVDKPLLILKHDSVLQLIRDVVAPQVAALALNTAGARAEFAAFGLPLVPDELPGRQGPLAGLLAGLDWAARAHPHAEWLLSVPGDTPFLPADLAARLQAARRQTGQAMACARSGGRMHPTIALWPIACREGLRAALAAGERRIGRFAATLGCAEAEWPALPHDPFLNVNTPEDLAAARALAERLSAAGAEADASSPPCPEPG